MAPFKKRPVRKHRAYRRKPRATARGRNTGVSSAVKLYVNRTIHRDQENKSANFNFNVDFGNILQNTTMNMVPLLPYLGYGSIPQGITQGSRIGNEIKIRKLMLNYVLHPTAYNATTNPFPAPIELDMFLGYVKIEPGILPGLSDLGNLFQAGSVSFPPVGGLNDLVSTVNTDYWHISKRWRHKIGYSNYSGTGSNPVPNYYTNNDFKLNVVKKLDITKFVSKTLKFNDSNNTLQGKNLFFFYQAVNAQGTLNTSGMTPCRIDYWVDIQYEDS